MRTCCRATRATVESIRSARSPPCSPRAALDNAANCGHKGKRKRVLMPREHVEGPGFCQESARAFVYPASAPSIAQPHAPEPRYHRLMYITDLTHFLDEKGAIAPMPTPPRLAEFLGRSWRGERTAAIDEASSDDVAATSARGSSSRRSHPTTPSNGSARAAATRPHLQLATIVLGSVAHRPSADAYPKNATARRAILGTLRANPQNHADSDPR